METRLKKSPARQWPALQPVNGKPLVMVDLSQQVFIVQPPAGTQSYARALEFSRSLQEQRPGYGICSPLRPPIYLPISGHDDRHYVRRLGAAKLEL